jgi:hypothetical protein
MFRPQPDNERRPVFRVVTSPGEAEEHLRVIRQAMERSTKFSTLSGLSGVVVGLLALIGCFVTDRIQSLVWDAVAWTAVMLLCFVTDFVFTKRRAARVGKHPRSPLAKHLARAAAPGFLAGAAFTLFHLLHPAALGTYLYAAWMLCYAGSLLSVGMFSVREVSVLGWAFLAAGALTLLIPPHFAFGPRAMMAVTFGGFHVAYGVYMGNRYGW